MNYETLGMVVGALVFIFGGLATLWKMQASIRKERDEENQKILKSANEYADAKYHALEQELEHQKDMNEGKIAELSKKIDELKDELSHRHTQLMDFLIKSIEKE